MGNMWDEFTITLPCELREPVTAVLYGLGCDGITEERSSITAYIPVSVGAGNVMEALSRFEGLEISKRLVEDQDWYASWKETFVPFEAEGIIVCPPWKSVEPDDGKMVMSLDPGQAFGTGDHVTTQMVLRMVRQWCEAQENVGEKDFLDFGTGTGILSIAGYFFGLRKLTAVDFEEKAIETAGRNLSLNRLVGKVKLRLGSVGVMGGDYDLIAANIFLESALELLPFAKVALKPGGVILVSGLLTGQDVPVVAKAGELGFRLVEREERSGWVCLNLSL